MCNSKQEDFYFGKCNMNFIILFVCLFVCRDHKKKNDDDDDIDWGSLKPGLFSYKSSLFLKILFTWNL